MTPVSAGGHRQGGRVVADLDKSVAFYGDLLGLDLIRRFDNRLAFFDLDGIRLLLESDPEATADTSTLYFAVPDIHAAYADLANRGVFFYGEPHLIFADPTGTFGEPGEEEWMAFFRDPDGHVLALAARIPGSRS